MALIGKFLHRIDVKILDCCSATGGILTKYYYCNDSANAVENKENDFRVLEIRPQTKNEVFKKGDTVLNLPTPRTKKMSTDQDWSNVWPGPKTFHPAAVPLPLRQGYNKKGAPPGKFGNAELMKIPNFLHLTPPAIKKHCEALKKFCTQWPEELETDEDLEKHFPIEIITSDYCHSSPFIGDPLGRIVSLRVKLKNLNLDKHAEDKLLRLVEDRYDPKTDYITITTDSCPIKKQNYEYAQYLLTAIVYESWKEEPWEKEKTDQDQETYVFEKRKAYQNVKQVFEYCDRKLPDLTEFGKAVEDLHNDENNIDNVRKYKEESLKLLSLSSN
ncbi:28S ribosomal protein S35, putative [Pediculus humanus corporis]|uniref:28S ribosomal protein S35, putative n=1 Tax=Pediculus humanus subsp. corporis TaxID=121224 RepID=E0VT12_PEDHC|nr:28S ribosomal protein S35, putative [Pediculus humanus corporis]EEB16518.1 28S ribosomal protein S35, putative [Pediculus humanus corporis]